MLLKLLKKYNVPVFLFVLIILSGLLRFYNLSNIYIFAFDEEYQATYAMTLVNDLHPIWIGVSASFLDFYLGPYFTYFTAFWLWISHGDPLITAYIASIVGIITSVVVFYIGRRFFNLTTGVISSLLYTTLPLIVFYDQKYWNPMFVQLTVLLMYSALILVKKSPWWWLLYTALAGIIFETDLAPLPLCLIGVWYFVKGKYWLNKKLFFSCILVFIFFYWPLIVFDYYHNWSNSTAISRYNANAKKSGAFFNPQDKIISLIDTVGRFWYLAPGRSNADELHISCYSLSTRPQFKFIDKYSERTFPSLWISIFSFIILFIFFALALGKNNPNHRLLVLFLFVSLVFYITYSGGPFEYYLHGFLTLYIFVPGILISMTKGKYKYFLIFLVGVVLVLGVNTILNASDKFSLYPKKRLIEKVMNIVGNEKFAIDGMGVCHNLEGWRYLFKVYGKLPSQSYTDQNFAWLYPKEIDKNPVTYEVILSETRLPKERNLEGYTRLYEGGYSAYIKKIK